MSILPSIVKQIKIVAHLVGLDIKRYTVSNSEELLLRAILANFDIQTIIDVGGNEGQYALKVIEGGFKGRIYSFEPIQSIFVLLEANTRSHTQWTAIHSAIGAQEGELTLNVSENFASSSIFSVNEKSIEAEPRTRTMRQEKVKIGTIDRFLEENSDMNKNVMLKLDIQGYELEALKGAVKTIPLISVVQAEVSFVPLYEGAPLHQKIVDFLRPLGFEIYTIIPGFRNETTGQLLQADYVFFRKS